MYWLRLSIVILTLSSTAWRSMCTDVPFWQLCESLYPDRQSETLCIISNEKTFKLQCPDSALAFSTCNRILTEYYFSGFQHRRDFLPYKTKPIKDEDLIYFENCDLPKTGLGTVTKQLRVNEAYLSNFTSPRNETSLTKETFHGFNNIQKLVLHFNNLSHLTEDLLGDLRNLTYVDLQANNIEKIPGNFFGSSNLKIINLGSNRLKTLQVHTFDRLANLQSLTISHNELTNLFSHTFDGLTSLAYLNMNGNFLESLPEDIFKKMPKLSFLHIAHNNFTGKALNKNLLKDKKKLLMVSMSDNKRNMTDLPSGFFANLPSLVFVNLTNDGLNHLPEDLFWGTTKLVHVNLARNFLETLPSMIFKDAKRLVWLDLSFNNLTSLRDGVFDDLSSLKFLDLSVNHLTNISK